jgi:hypothetical protein
MSVRGLEAQNLHVCLGYDGPGPPWRTGACGRLCGLHSVAVA